jgi:hypothetical protein
MSTDTITTENTIFEDAFNRILNAVLAFTGIVTTDDDAIAAAMENYNEVFANKVFNASHNPVGCVMKGMRKAARGNAQDNFTMWDQGVKDARAMHAENIRYARKLTAAH